jgi:uncharacterized protein YgiM (DUF1202 family)
MSDAVEMRQAAPVGRRTSRRSGRRAGRLLPAILAVGGLALLTVGAMWGIGQLGERDQSASLPNAQTYETVGAVAVRQSAGNDGRTVSTLREGSRVAGSPAGTVDGAPWVQIVAIDGTRGFVPAADLRALAPSATASEVVPTTRRVLTSTLVNLRERPSISADIIGVAEGGTRLIVDGTIQAEGETWLRVPLNESTTVWLNQRFTTLDEESSGSDEGFERAGATVGVTGEVTTITNVQATPMRDARVIRALAEGEAVRILGQTFSEGWWYVLRLDDGSQGFAPKESVKVTQQLGRWVYPDGTEAPGPGVPQGSRPSTGTSSDSRTGQEADGSSNPEAVPVAPEAEAQAATTDGTSGGPAPEQPPTDPVPALPQ